MFTEVNVALLIIQNFKCNWQKFESLTNDSCLSKFMISIFNLNIYYW